MESSLKVDENFEPNYGLKLGVKEKVRSTLEKPCGPSALCSSFLFLIIFAEQPNAHKTISHAYTFNYCLCSTEIPFKYGQ